jgi:hypothetical protein
MPHAPNGLFEKDSLGNWRAKPYYVELLDTFVSRAKKHGHRLLHETRNTPDEYYTEFSAHLKHGAVNHLAVGKKITFETPPDARYPGGGPDALIDGFRASTNYQFGWQGWYGKDMVATIDLGTPHRIDSVSIAFLQDQQSWIFLPSEVRWQASVDGSVWREFAADRESSASTKGELSVHITDHFHGTEARYIRITAKNLGPLPAWHGSKGECWLFCDEIVVR